ncbi:pyocin activator PrtN family protein [Azotobacter chroococcum]|uniref:pyocin activator PrtN family protein n=1 Tax=Azotobacter chroococcum TaxID=353 RepID=UPI0030B916A2
MTATTSQARTPEGRGESTLQLLRQRYRCNYITVEQLLQDHLPHISNKRHLLAEIRAGRIAIPLGRLHDSIRAPRIIYLNHLADFLDQAEKTAATAAA